MMQTNQGNPNRDEDVSVGTSHQQEEPMEAGPNAPKEAKGSQPDTETASVNVAGSPVDTTRFPWKLHAMLTQIEKGGSSLEDIVSWQPHGRSFAIRDRRAFIDKVMPKYFYQLKYVSFQRQLNLYGFKKVYHQGPDKGAYYHEQFLRGMTELSGTIQRVKAVKGAVSRKSKSDEPEIDHYALPALDEKAELSKAARAKALEEAARSIPVGKGKKKAGGRKRQSSSKKTITATKKAAKAASNEARSEYLEPSPFPILPTHTHHDFPTSPSISRVLGSALGNVHDVLAQGLPSLSEAAMPSEMQHMQDLQQELRQQTPHGLSSNALNPSVGLPSFASHRASSLLTAHLHGDTTLTQPWQAPQAPTPSAMQGGTCAWDFEPTPIKPGVALEKESKTATAHAPQFKFTESFVGSQLFQQQQGQYDPQQQFRDQQQQQMLLRDLLFEQQRQQLLPSMSATEQTSVFFQQQQSLMEQMHQQPEAASQVPQPTDNLQDDMQQLFSNQGGSGNSWMT